MIAGAEKGIMSRLQGKTILAGMNRTAPIEWSHLAIRNAPAGDPGILANFEVEAGDNRSAI